MDNIKAVYFVGIGGIGMSAIARYFLNLGLTVGGYDRTPSELTRRLAEEGAHIHYEENIGLIPIECLDPDTCLVIYTPAIPAEHSELQYFQRNGFDLQKRAQVLGSLTQAMKGLCVAGTHGKTTTSSMAAHLLHQSHVDCNAFLGGITKNYGTNYILSDKSDFVVIEADEFDRSFHWLTPWATVITATDADHLDIFHAENVKIGNGEISFDFVSPLGNISNINLGVPVSVNIENGIGAMALAQLAGATEEEIRNGMASFSGVDRRFDFHLRTPEMVYLSDYAHHPEEIRQSILSVKELYEGRHVKVIFQPHLYSRTRDFYREFADALSLLDDVAIVDIYPAREQPIPGITSQIIYDNLRPGIQKELIHKEQIPELVSRGGFDVLVTLGAGDIDDYANEITQILSKKV